MSDKLYGKAISSGPSYNQLKVGNWCTFTILTRSIPLKIIDELKEDDNYKVQAEEGAIYRISYDPETRNGMVAEEQPVSSSMPSSVAPVATPS